MSCEFVFNVVRSKGRLPYENGMLLYNVHTHPTHNNCIGYEFD